MLDQWNELKNYLREHVADRGNRQSHIDMIAYGTYLDVLRELEKIETRTINDSLKEAGY